MNLCYCYGLCCSAFNLNNKRTLSSIIRCWHLSNWFDCQPVFTNKPFNTTSYQLEANHQIGVVSSEDRALPLIYKRSSAPSLDRRRCTSDLSSRFDGSYLSTSGFSPCSLWNTTSDLRARRPLDDGVVCTENTNRWNPQQRLPLDRNKRLQLEFVTHICIDWWGGRSIDWVSVLIPSHYVMVSFTSERFSNLETNGQEAWARSALIQLLRRDEGTSCRRSVVEPKPRNCKMELECLVLVSHSYGETP